MSPSSPTMALPQQSESLLNSVLSTSRDLFWEEHKDLTEPERWQRWNECLGRYTNNGSGDNRSHVSMPRTLPSGFQPAKRRATVRHPVLRFVVYLLPLPAPLQTPLNPTLVHSRSPEINLRDVVEPGSLNWPRYETDPILRASPVCGPACFGSLDADRTFRTGAGSVGSRLQKP